MTDSSENIYSDNIFETNYKEAFSIFRKYKAKNDNISWLIDFLASDTFISDFYPDIHYLTEIHKFRILDALLAVIWVVTKREWNKLFIVKYIKPQLTILDDILKKISLNDRPQNTYNYDRIHDIEDYLNYLLTIISDDFFINSMARWIGKWSNISLIITSSGNGTYEEISNLLPDTKYIKIPEYDGSSRYIFKPYAVDFYNYAFINPIIYTNQLFKNKYED